MKAVEPRFKMVRNNPRAEKPFGTIHLVSREGRPNR